MKVNIIAKDTKQAGSIELPAQFNEAVRPDLIKRAVLALQAAKRQKYGADPEAGLRASVRISKRRHAYRGTYGIGQSRTPRKVMSYRGTRFNWTGAFAPQTVGGRRAHPAKAEKDWDQKINDKERRKAIRSALAATMDKATVAARGHKVPDTYPFIISTEFETIEKTKDILALLEAQQLKDELARAADRTVRAGKGKMRGRKYKQATSLLIVTSEDCKLTNAADNIPGVDVVNVQELNAELLAPGTVPGRLTLYTEAAIKKLAADQLFMNKKKAAVKSEEKKPAKTTKKAAEVSA